MRIAVCDDEKIFRAILLKELNEYADSHGQSFIITEYSDGSELLVSEIPYDLIFLDHQMKKTNGIDTIDTLRKRNIHTTVIFVSSYQEIVFESLKYKTFRFLVKPLDRTKLYEALDSVIKEMQELVYIIVRDKTSGENLSISAADIIYCQADNNYVTIITLDGTFNYPHKISQLEDELVAGYIFRTNRSYLVNFNHIKSYNQKEITLSNGHKALVSKLSYKKFKQAYLTYLKNKSVG